MYQNFAADGKDALLNFEELFSREDAIEAQADTGSRYTVHITPTIDGRGDVHVVVVNPITSVFRLTPGSYVTARYIVAQTGMVHGGDIYAIMECLRRVAGVSYREPAR